MICCWRDHIRCRKTTDLFVVGRQLIIFSIVDEYLDHPNYLVFRFREFSFARLDMDMAPICTASRGLWNYETKPPPTFSSIDEVLLGGLQRERHPSPPSDFSTDLSNADNIIGITNLLKTKSKLNISVTQGTAWKLPITSYVLLC